MERRGYQYQLPQCTTTAFRQDESRNTVEFIAECVALIERENRMLDEGCILIEEALECGALYPYMLVGTTIENLTCKGEVEKFRECVPENSELSKEENAPRRIVDFLTYWWQSERVISRHDKLRDANDILMNRRIGNADLILENAFPS